MNNLTGQSEGRKNWIPILFNGPLLWTGYIILVCLLSAVFFGSLKDHLLDVHDYETFQDNIAIGEDFSFFFSPEKQQPTGRLVSDLVKFLAYLIGGNDPAFFHLVVVAFHTLATILLARLAWRLGTSLRLSLAGSLLFLLNVAHFQAVHHISALDYPLALSLGLGAMLFYLRHLSSGGLLWLGAYYCAVATGLMAHLSVLFVVPLCIYWSLSKGFTLKKILRPFFPLFALTGFQLAFIFSLTGGNTSTWRAIWLYSENNPFSLFPSTVQLFLWLLSRLLTTAHWILIPLYKWQSSELYTGICVLAILLFFVFRNRSPAPIWALWTLLSLLPFVIINDPLIRDLPWYFSRYLYFASAGTSILVALGIEGLCMTFRSYGRHLHAGILVAVFSSSYFHLKQVEAISLYSSGRHYLAKGDFETGAKQLRIAILSGPATIDLPDAYARLCYVNIGKLGQESILREALSAAPLSATLNICKLVTDSIKADSLTSHQARTKLDAFKTPDSQVQVEIGPGLWIRLREKGEIVGWNNQIADLYHNFGNALSKQNDLRNAIFSYRRAVEFNSGRILIYQKLVAALAKAGFPTEAAFAAREAVEHNPKELQRTCL